jgi:hypothetical protein
MLAKIAAAVVASSVLGLFAAGSARAEEVLVNGGFETGDFTGWTATNAPFLEPCRGDWRVNSTGETDCISRPVPTSGTFAAYNSFDANGPWTFTLEQSVTVPLTVTSAQLSWLDTVVHFEHGGAPRTFTIAFFDASDVNVGTVHTFATTPDLPQDIDWTPHAVDVTAILAAHAGETLTLRVENFVPENFTGGAGFGADAFSLDVVSALDASCTVRRAMLWPATRGLLDVGLDVTVTGGSGSSFSNVSVYSDEEDAGPPYSPDATWDGATLRLRAERSTAGNGRVYLIIVTTFDFETFEFVHTCCTVICPLRVTTLHLSALMAEATAAHDFCEANGEPPPGFFPVTEEEEG